MKNEKSTLWRYLWFLRGDPENNSFRASVLKIVKSPIFERFIIGCILLNSIAIGIPDYSHATHDGNLILEGSIRNSIANIADFIFTIVFIIKIQ
jgi:hypothetical protein